MFYIVMVSHVAFIVADLSLLSSALRDPNDPKFLIEFDLWELVLGNYGHSSFFNVMDYRAATAGLGLMFFFIVFYNNNTCE